MTKFYSMLSGKLYEIRREYPVIAFFQRRMKEVKLHLNQRDM